MCDVSCSVTETIAAELVIHADANALELFLKIIFVKYLIIRLRARDIAVKSIKPMQVRWLSSFLIMLAACRNPERSFV